MDTLRLERQVLTSRLHAINDVTTQSLIVLFPDYRLGPGDALAEVEISIALGQ